MCIYPIYCLVPLVSLSIREDQHLANMDSVGSGATLGKRPISDVTTAAPTTDTATSTVSISPEEVSDAVLRDPQSYSVSKRVPLRRESASCDVYVTRQTRMRALIQRCVSRLDRSGSVCVHAMGAAINKACDLALAVERECNGNVEIGMKTDSVQVFDDYTPLKRDLPMVTKRRIKSAVHITITTTAQYT